ncbi:MAG TPA: methyltransferase [Polyangia bacterium]|nr:methyltransferase [Polyangia bacterium]
MGNWALLAAFAGCFVLVIVTPMARLKRRTGEWGLALARRGGARGAEEAMIGGLLGFWLLAALGWAAACAALGPRALGVWRAPAAVGAAGWALIAAGLALTALAQAQMGASWRIGIDARATPLVTSGLYHATRNPIYAAMALALAGAVLVTPCAWTVMAWLAIAQAIAWQARLEERHLAALHGDRFRAYAARVGRFVPLVGRLR